jgi:hypothetical protein
MKIFTNILQFLLSLWLITGSVYMLGHYSLLASEWAGKTLPNVFWIILGVVQIIFAVILLLSIKSGRLRKYATISSVILAIIVLSGIVLYSAYSGFSGMLWAIVPASLLAFIAYRRKTEMG